MVVRAADGSMDAELDQATLLFRQQSDGRKVARLPSGKVVLVELESLAKVGDNEWWLVRLRHKENFSIATPLEKVSEPQARPGVVAVSPAPASTAASTLAKVVPVVHARPERIFAPFEVGGMLIEPENILRSHDRVAIFVDGANMDHACRAAGYWVDYRKARDYFVGPGNFYAGFYYTVDVTATDPVQTRFLDFLSYSGYIVRRKPMKRIRDQDTGAELFKGNLDTMIVLDMLNTVDNYDVAFLFSGDSDFEALVEVLRSRGKRVYVVTSRNALSRELAYVADKPVFLIEDFRSQLQRDEKAVE